jgi:hypothetical protein
MDAIREASAQHPKPAIEFQYGTAGVSILLKNTSIKQLLTFYSFV